MNLHIPRTCSNESNVYKIQSKSYSEAVHMKERNFYFKPLAAFRRFDYPYHSLYDTVNSIHFCNCFEVIVESYDLGL